MNKKILIIFIFTSLVITSIYGKNKELKLKTENSLTSINEIKKDELKPILIPVKKNGVWGYSDIKGTIIIEPKYREAENFRDGLAVIKDYNEIKATNKYGVINSKGEIIVKADYDYIKGFKNGFTVVKAGEKYGIINKTGVAIVPIVFDELSDFSENLAFFKSEGKYGYIGSNGRVKIKPIFDKAFEFNNGIAKVIIGDKIGFINNEGKLIKEQFFKEGRDFKNGLAAVKEESFYGYINSKEEYVIKPEYENGFNFSEGLAAVKKDSKYGFINLKGDMVILPEYDYAFAFKDSVAVVEKQKKFSYIGIDGKKLFNSDFDEAFSFNEGIARVKVNGKYGFIDISGKLIIDNKYNSAIDFENGLAKVELNSVIMYIDKSGKEYLFEGVEIKNDNTKPIDDIINLKQDALLYTDKNKENISLVDSSYQKLMEKNFNATYFSPWHTKKAYTSKNEFTWILNNYEKEPGFGENKLKHNSNWMIDIRANCEEKSFPSMFMKAITVADTGLRLLPTNKPSFDSFDSAGGGYPFDNLQNSAVNINTPIVIIHKSKDGAWYFVETAFAPGWVSANDIAFVDEKFISEWEYEKFIAISNDNCPMIDESGVFRFYANVGALFPKISEDNLNYTVKIAISDTNKNGIIKTSKLLKENSLIKPNILTQKNIAQIINKVIDKPYGWGGMNEDRDCSATLRDLFAPFGLWLPRNSAEQAKSGIYFSLKNLSPADKEKMLLDNGVPYVTIIWLKGHIMLYIGNNNGRAIVFHNTWGIKTKDINGKEGRKIIGGSVITTLEPGKELPDSYGTILSKIEGFTILVPPLYIQKILSDTENSN